MSRKLRRNCSIPGRALRVDKVADKLRSVNDRSKSLARSDVPSHLHTTCRVLDDSCGATIIQLVKAEQVTAGLSRRIWAVTPADWANAVSLIVATFVANTKIHLLLVSTGQDLANSSAI